MGGKFAAYQDLHKDNLNMFKVFKHIFYCLLSNSKLKQFLEETKQKQCGYGFPRKLFFHVAAR